MHQGQRQKRLEERQKRFEQEEEEKKKIDIEEALYQAEKRKAAIEKAKLQQYYQTDRIKELHVSRCKKINVFFFKFCTVNVILVNIAFAY